MTMVGSGGSPDLGPVTLGFTHSATPIKRGPDTRDTLSREASSERAP